MASRSLKGITVEIDGSTIGLQSALKEVSKEIKNTESQLKDVEKLLKLDPSNTELLAQKQRLLTDAIKETKADLHGRFRHDGLSQAGKDSRHAWRKGGGRHREHLRICPRRPNG